MRQKFQRSKTTGYSKSLSVSIIALLIFCVGCRTNPRQFVDPERATVEVIDASFCMVMVDQAVRPKVAKAVAQATLRADVTGYLVNEHGWYVPHIRFAEEPSGILVDERGFVSQTYGKSEVAHGELLIIRRWEFERIWEEKGIGGLNEMRECNWKYLPVKTIRVK